MYNFINDNYKVDFPVPDSLMELIKEAEKYDKEDCYGMYQVYADGIDVSAKKMLCSGSADKKAVGYTVCAIRAVREAQGDMLW